MKTIMPKQIKNENRNWYVIDAKGQTLGRLSTKVAILLKGKNKVDFSPHLDNGDYVIILNSDKFYVSGKKMENKIYYSHSGYLGGLKEINLKKLLDKKPNEVLKKSISGMLPKNKLRSNMMKRLKIINGTEHFYKAQKPEKINL